MKSLHKFALLALLTSSITMAQAQGSNKMYQHGGNAGNNTMSGGAQGTAMGQASQQRKQLKQQDHSAIAGEDALRERMRSQTRTPADASITPMPVQ